MLHLIVATHSPEACPMVNLKAREKFVPKLKKLEALAKPLDITVQGAWTDIVSHKIYIIVDAPNAHVVSKMTMDNELAEWNRVKIRPIVTMKETLSLLDSKKS